MEINLNKQQEEEKQKESPVETVLVLQGGGSLGAYECGVYKTLAKHKIKFDIISGTSIGAQCIITKVGKALQKNLKTFG